MRDIRDWNTGLERWSVTAFTTFILTLALCPCITAQTIEPMKHCATTPTYKYFEQVQYDAYTSNPDFQQILIRLRNSQDVFKALRETDELLRKRDNPLGGRGWKSGETDEYIKRSLGNLKLPTCYENPLTFFMLTEYAREVDKARRDLGLPLPSQVNLATLPTTEVNAYTYPATGDIGSVIALNTQLFMFAYQMTKVTLPTIGIENAEQIKRISVDHSKEQALIAIATKPDIQTNFTMALLEFLALTSPSTEPLAQSYDPLVITFTEGMEKFAVAHEYGHVIKKHTSPTVSIRLGADVDGRSEARSVPVLARSWKQELEADQVGFQLLLRALKDEAKGNASNDLHWVYTLKGALFFFKCLDIVDQAKIVKDTGKLPTPPSMAERVFVREFADGKSSAEQNARYHYLTIATHPPAWFRLERIQQMIESDLRAHPPSPSALAFADIADGILDNVQLLWTVVSPVFPIAVEGVRLQKTNKSQFTDDQLKQLRTRAEAERDQVVPGEFPPGCFVEVDSWASSFLCDPSLQKAVAMFQDVSADDVALITQYKKALDADWILLSGIQARWAQSRLMQGHIESRQDALAILALSGDRQSLDDIDTLQTGTWSDADRQLLMRAKTFLINYGRDTSTKRLAAVDPASLRLVDFLCFPSPLDSSTNVSTLIPPKITPAAMNFLSRNSAVRLGRSISSIALATIAEGKRVGDTYGILADLLQEAGATDAALKLANAGIALGGSPAALENSIGNILSAKHELAAANEHYAASLAAGRMDGWPELNTAVNLSDMGDLDGAEKWFRLALSRRATVRSQTELARYLNEFAWFLATNRSNDDSKLKEALSLSEESNQIIRRRNPNYLDTLAECQARTGNMNAAVKTAEEALSLVSDDPGQKQKYAERLESLKSKLQK